MKLKFGILLFVLAVSSITAMDQSGIDEQLTEKHKQQKFEQDIRRDLDSRKRMLKTMEDNEHSWGLEQQRQSYLKAINKALSEKYPFQDEWLQLKEQFNRMEQQDQVREAAKQKQEEL